MLDGKYSSCGILLCQNCINVIDSIMKTKPGDTENYNTFLRQHLMFGKLHLETQDT